MVPTFFETPAELRRWLEANHATSAELWIGIYKKGCGRGGVTYKQALDEALCFGWIDGVLRRVDEACYMQRFTPRRPRSTWSAINIARAGELIAAGRMRPAGQAAFERRAADRSRLYTHEQERPVALSQAQQRVFRKHPRAWAFFISQPPSYQRACAWWIQAAKKDETRARRLTTLIDVSARGKYPSPFIPRPGK
jgi:uncharacterized protein YdeI (YjbR/CyaY-like superfamily)